MNEKYFNGAFSVRFNFHGNGVLISSKKVKGEIVTALKQNNINLHLADFDFERVLQLLHFI